MRLRLTPLGVGLVGGITVQYSSGPSQAQGLTLTTADTRGVSWSWKVGTHTTPGPYPITISCSHGGSVTVHFAVA